MISRASLRRLHLSPIAALLFAFLPLGSDRLALAQPAQTTVQAVLLSDIHFDPFWDPAKVSQLAQDPLAKWPADFEMSASPDRQAKYLAILRACGARGEDTSYPLLRAGITAMKASIARARFVTIGGDLLAHSFDCKFKTVFPGSSPKDLAAFAEKTIDFVLEQLNNAAGSVPVYAALGNNDSDCGDYRIDANGAFLRDVGQAITQRFPQEEKAAALASFSADGSYAIALPAPMTNTRLIVLDDLFSSVNYAGCSGKPDTAGQDAQLAWFAGEIAAARAARQKVWVMAHIPPGVDAYGTVKHMSGACTHPPVLFLSSSKLGDALTDAADVVMLAIFGHTHEDEIRLLDKQPPSGNNTGTAAVAGVPAKLVPSISPINGNEPSFTSAKIDPATATMVDYKVFAGSEAGPWTEQYDYAQAYGETSFSAASVSNLVGKFAADPEAKTKSSRNYIKNFITGHPMPLLALVWPQYVCTMTRQTAAGYKQCGCGGGR